MVEVEERVGKVEEALAFFMTETARLFAEMREDIAEIRASNARTDRMLLEMQQQAEKDRQQAEKDRQQAEKDRQQAEKDRRDFNRRLAETTDAQGLLIENMVWPNLKRIASEVFRGEDVLFQAIRLKRRLDADHSRMMELDLLAVGERDVVVCEAKSRVTVEKVREFRQSLETFEDFFPEYAGRRLWPMVASVYIDPSVIAFMTSQKVLAVGFGGETMDLLNPEALG
jgi:uncharacterized membrane-anchored protein YhcB (DUF1043 family)